MVFKKSESKLIMSSAICNLLLRSWGELSQEDAAQRNYLIGLYFDTLTKEFRELNNTSEEAKMKRVIENTLPVLAYCVDYSKKFTNVSKKLLCAAVKVNIILFNVLILMNVFFYCSHQLNTLYFYFQIP